MLKNVLLIVLSILSFRGVSQTITPTENDEFCPHPDFNNANIAQPNVYLFTINFGAPANDYQIIVSASANNPVACKVIANISAPNGSETGTCYIAFQDQRDVTPQFSIKLNSTGELVKTFKFPFIRSLKGLKPHLIFPANIQLPLCNTGNITYSVDTLVKYKRTDNDNDFGSNIPYYEYSVPEGWKVGTETSTGQNNYIKAVPGATITYDEIHKGEIKIRASQRDYNCWSASQMPVAGDWVSIPFTRPDLKFSVNGGATAVNVTCGTSSTHTFTVENGPSNSCMSYVWNLGSANNNWLYNGSQADQYITTTANSLTLTTASCTGKPIDVSVTVRINNADLKVFPAIPVTMQVPQYSITGPNVICNDGNYVIENLPCSASVAWSVETYGNVPGTIAPNGNSVYVTKIDNGAMLLIGTITGLCATAPVVVTKDLKFGPPMGFNGSVFTGGANHALMTCNNLTTPYASGEYVGYVEVQDPVATYYGWGLFNKGSNTAETLMNNPDAQHVEVRIKAPQQGYATYTLARRNECGLATSLHTFRGNWICPTEVRMDVSNNPVSNGEASSNDITLAPNPAGNQVTIAIHTGNSEITNNSQDKITEVKIFDLLGRLSKQQRFNNATNVTVNVSDLINGLYFVEIIKGKERIKRNLIINR